MRLLRALLELRKARNERREAQKRLLALIDKSPQGKLGYDIALALFVIGFFGSLSVIFGMMVG